MNSLILWMIYLEANPNKKKLEYSLKIPSFKNFGGKKTYTATFLKAPASKIYWTDKKMP